MAQAKGSASQVLFDWEDTFGTARSAADRRPINVPFNTCDVSLTRPLNQAQTIRGDRNPTDPYQGNKDVNGNLTVPVDLTTIGLFFRGAVGAPTTSESKRPDDANAGGTGSISSGAATFRVAQGSAAVGDRVLWSSGGTRYEGFLTAGSGTSWTIKNERDGATNPADVTDATVDAIITNKAETSPGTISISSGTATFSATHANLAAGQMVIYDIENSRKVCFVTAKLTATTATVVDSLGHSPSDATTLEVECIETKPYFEHVFKIDDQDSLGSFVLERGFTDLSTPQYARAVGCKINTMEITVGGDGELLATLGIIGADETIETTAYDAEGAAPTAISWSTARYQQFDASIKEGGSTSNVLNEFTFRMDNALDTDSFVIGGSGKRRALPEGIAGVGGSIVALFEDDTILAKAEGNTESSLEVTFTSGSNSLVIDVNELKYQHRSPAIPGPAGIRLNLDWQGYYDDDTSTSAVVVTLTNQQAAYV